MVRRLGAGGILALAVALPAAAVVNLKVAGVTNTQAVIRYDAPSAAACTVEVSESADFSTLVHDVNPSLFPGSNFDSRPGSLSDNLSRAFVAGQRKLDTASNGLRYSRALQAATRHYVRVRCGQLQANTSFTTRTVPLGHTYADAIPYDPALPGTALLMNRDYLNRAASYIDPQTGVLVKYMTLPGDKPEPGLDKGLFQSTSLGANWAAANGILNDGGASAEYSGASCGATCDWLSLGITQTFYPTLAIDYIRLYLTGSGTSSDPEHRKVQACLSLNGTTCDPFGLIREVVLPSTPGSTVTIGEPVLVDTWRGANSPLSIGEVNGAQGIRVLLRKKTNTGSVSLDSAALDLKVSHTSYTSSGGNTERCSINQDSQGWYLCTAFMGGVQLWLYRVHGDTGESRHLGTVPGLSVPGVGFTGCSQDNAIWDVSVPSRMYCQLQSYVYQLDYTGDGNAKPAGQNAEFRFTLITDNLGEKVRAFVDLNRARYLNGFDTSRYRCAINGTKNTYLGITCARGAQDTYGWLAVMNTNGTVVAAMEYHTHPTSRWCGIHSYEEIGHQNVFETSTQSLGGNGVGGGYYRTTLTSPMTAGQGVITVAGEPLSLEADTYLMDAAVGDVFSIEGEYVRITARAGTAWTVERGILGSSASAHPGGSFVQARCAPAPGNWFYQAQTALQPVWRFLEDPYGQDRSGNSIWVNAYGGHTTARKHLIINNHHVAEGPEGSDLLYSVKNPAYTIRADDTPGFASKISASPGLTYQTHATWHNVNQTGFERKFWLDVRPFIGGNSISAQTPGCDPTLPNYPSPNGCAAARVPGTASIYKWTTASSFNFDGINTKHFATFATAGAGRILRPASGPQSRITDADIYTWCEAKIAGECVAGSVKDDIYAVVPDLKYFYCTGGESFGGQNDLCIADLMVHGNTLMQNGAYPQTGHEYSRILAREALGYAGRNMGVTFNAKALSNGKWALATSIAGRQDIALVKLPPAVKDSLDRSTFVSLSVAVGSNVTGAYDVLVEFGYDQTLRCSPNRNDTCLAHKAHIDENDPYSYAVEGAGGRESGLTGVLCSEGCTVAIPAIAERVVYYRIKYRDAAGNVLSTGPLQVRVAPSVRP